MDRCSYRKKKFARDIVFCIIFLALLQLSCRNTSAGPSKEAINAIQLKRGAVISCGPGETDFGSLDFAIPGTQSVKADFNLGVKLLHSFEYDEAEKVFARIID